MGLFHFLKKKKEKKQLEEVAQRYESEVFLENQKTDTVFAKKYMLEQCEEITQSVTDYVAAKQEYDELTKYLKDIQIIEGMDEQDRQKLTDVALNIVTINKAKKSMNEKVNRLQDSQFVLFDNQKEELPKLMKRLRDNENTRDIMKRDMDYLEGEKVEWMYEKTAIKQQQQILKTLSVFVLASEALFIIAFLATMILEYTTASGILLGVVFAVAVIESAVLLKMQNNKTDVLQCTLNYNKAVSIQNSIKIKYINIVNAVEFTCEKYKVRNAAELEKKWQYYLESVKEREKLVQANDDLNYYKSSMVRLLRMYQLYDAGIWPQQAEALANSKEMVEIKHSLLERRQKVRGRMENMNQYIIDSRQKILELGKKNNLMSSEVTGIMDSIDKLFG